MLLSINKDHVDKPDLTAAGEEFVRSNEHCLYHLGHFQGESCSFISMFNISRYFSALTSVLTMNVSCIVLSLLYYLMDKKYQVLNSC